MRRTRRSRFVALLLCVSVTLSMFPMSVFGTEDMEQRMPTEVVEFNGHKYKLFTEKKNWDDAKRFCEEQGGHLVTITSQAEQDFIEEQGVAWYDHVWIGATDISGQYEWVTGEPFEYTNWMEGQPDDAHGETEHYAIMRTPEWDDRRLNGDGEEKGYSFLCEWEDGVENVPDENNKIEFKGHQYQIFDEVLTWYEAKNKCESLGGHLVTITSKDENDFIKKEVLKGDSLYYWLGATDEEKEGAWKWVTGEEWTYSNWRMGQPDNQNRIEHYLMMYQDKDSVNGNGLNGLWNDESIDCSEYVELNRQGYICEWDEENNLEFNRAIYHANFLVNNDQDPNNHQAPNNIMKCLNEQTPASRLIDDMRNSGVEDKLELLETIKIVFTCIDDISESYDYAVGAKELYQTIIFSSLEKSTESMTYETVKNAEGWIGNLISRITDVLKTKHNLTVTKDLKISELTKEQMNSLMEEAQAFYEEELGDLVYIPKIFEGVSIFYDAETAFSDYLATVNGYAAIWSLSEANKLYMQELYDVCPNNEIGLKAALRECKQIINTSIEEFQKELTAGVFKTVGIESVKFAVKKIWGKALDKVKLKSFTLSALLIGYKTGSFISNALFNTDEFKGAYFEALAMTELESLADAAMSGIKNDFLREKSQKNAELLLSAYDFSFSFRAMDCEKAKALPETLEDSIANKIISIWKGEGFENLYNWIELRRKNYVDYEKIYLLSWIENLCYDFPGTGLYEKYEYLKEERDEERYEKYVIACPVNVFIYTQSGRLVGKVVDNVPWVGDSSLLTIGVEGDEKTLYISKELEYRIEYVGTDKGDMSISIDSYIGEHLERSIRYYDLPLENGLTYISQNNDEYVLEEDSGTIIPPQTDSEKSKNYNLEIQFGFASNEETAGKTKLLEGELVEISPLIPEGYSFVRWETKNSSVKFENPTNEQTSFYMPNEDVVVYAKVKKENGSEGDIGGGTIPPISTPQYTIEASAEAGGTISPSGISKIDRGLSKTYTIMPNEGYQIANVIVDGKSVGAVSEYTFENVAVNHTIVAKFEKKEILPSVDEQIAAIKSAKIKVSTSIGKNKRGQRYIKVQWTEPETDADGYEIYRSFRKNSDYKKFYTTKKCRYFNTKQLKAGKRHYYKVRAYKVIDGKRYYSRWSNLAYRTLPELTVEERIADAKAVKLKATTVTGINKKGQRYIKVKWTKTGASVSGYDVYRSFKKTDGYKKIFTAKKQYYYNTKELKKGRRHYYKVRAYTLINSKKYYSKWSNLAYRTLGK